MNRNHVIEVAKKCGAFTKINTFFTFEPQELEAFAQQIRNEALKEAAEKCLDIHNGQVKADNSGWICYNAILAMIKE